MQCITPCEQEYQVGPSSEEEVPMQAPKFAKGPPLPTDSAPSSVSGWSTAAPAAHSAREMWKQELLHNKIEKARLEEREKAKVLEAKCEELRKQLKAAKKRSRSTDASAAASATTLEDEAVLTWILIIQ